MHVCCALCGTSTAVDSWYTSQTLKGLSRSLTFSLRSTKRKNVVRFVRQVHDGMFERVQKIVRRNEQTLRILLNQLPTICPSHNWRSLFLLLVFRKRSNVLQNYFTYYKVAPFVFSSSEENEQGTNSRQLSSAGLSSPFSTILLLSTMPQRCP